MHSVDFSKFKAIDFLVHVYPGGIPIKYIYGKCRNVNPSTNRSTTSTGNIQGWSQKKQTKTFEVDGILEQHIWTIKGR